MEGDIMQYPKIAKLLTAGVAGMTLLTQAGEALAQDSGAADDRNAAAADMDIVVTARRREENIQTVPVAVTAFGSEALVQKNIQATTDLQRIVPGVIFVGAGSAANTTFSIRGQGKDVAGPGLPSVISYFNEVPLPSWGAVLPAFDVASVQVLKGPQGTLFGRNTTGGAVLVYSKPAVDKFEGYVQGTAGDYFWHALQGAINLPIADGIALRVAGDFQKRDGYQKDIGVAGDGSNLNSRAFRVTLKIEPSPTFSNVTVFDYYWQHTNGDGYVSVGDAGPNAAYRFFPAFNCGVSAACDVDLANAEQRRLGFHVTNSNIPGYDRTRLWGISNTTTLDLGAVTIKNIFGYRDTKVDQQFSTDGLPLFLLDTRGFRYDRQISNELQFSGDLMDGKLQWLVGGFFLDLKPTGPDAFAIDAFDAAGDPDNNPFGQISNNLFKDRSYALFGNLTFEIMDGLRLNAGYRHTWDKESVCAVNTRPFFGDPIQSTSECEATAGSFSDSVKFKASTYTLGADYQVSNDIFTYVTVRRGYRAGGINTPRLAGTLTPFQYFGPQKVNDVEIGLKTQWEKGEMRGRLNVAAFRGIFSHLQRQIAGLPPDFDGDGDPATDPANTSLNINGGKAKVQGVEVDGILQPVEPLILSFGASYLDAKYTSLETPPVFAAQAGGSAIYERAPKWSYTLSGSYRLPVDAAGADVTLRSDYYWIGSYFAGIAKVPSYGVLNGSVEFSNIGNTALSATLFVTNILDKVYLRNSNLIGTSPGNFSFSTGEPRIYGLRVRYDFGG